ncbi:MAG: hypothetical protein HDT29_07580 [Clostridiales bacterium]|nr:hypothetical protein [Clostridiales bacterium]
MKIYFCKDCVDIQKAKEGILKRHFPCDDILIEYLPSGQPILIKDGEQSGYVSISHTENTLVIAFADKPVGIDVERKSRKISSKVCESIEEWTRRESYGKYLGVGINKEVLSAQLPDKLINAFYQGEYVVSVCGEEYNEGIETLIDNASFE